MASTLIVSYGFESLGVWPVASLQRWHWEGRRDARGVPPCLSAPQLLLHPQQDQLMSARVNVPSQNGVEGQYQSHGQSLPCSQDISSTPRPALRSAHTHHTLKSTLIPSHRFAASAPMPVKHLCLLQVSCFQPSAHTTPAPPSRQHMHSASSPPARSLPRLTFTHLDDASSCQRCFLFIFKRVWGWACAQCIAQCLGDDKQLESDLVAHQPT